MIVKVKSVGVKLAGKWCFKNETAEINKKEYENNKEYVEVIQEDIEEPENPEGEQEISKNDDRDTNVGSIEEKNDPEGNNEEDARKNNESEDEELKTLKEEAKKLGINVTHNMKKETIIKKIEEANIKNEEPENPEGE